MKVVWDMTRQIDYKRDDEKNGSSSMHTHRAILRLMTPEHD